MSPLTGIFALSFIFVGLSSVVALSTWTLYRLCYVFLNVIDRGITSNFGTEELFEVSLHLLTTGYQSR